MFEELHIPPHIGVLSIDVDGQDYWIWKALAPHFRADIVIIEVNSAHPHPYGVEQETNTFYGDLTRTWGAAPRAMAALGRSLGYRPVHVELAGANLFLVHESAVTRAPEIIGELDRVANYGLTRSGHPDSVLFPSGPGDDRPWTETTSTP